MQDESSRIYLKKFLCSFELQYDEEWLAITRKFHCIIPLTRRPAQLRAQLIDIKENE
ncbi:hypothetical protein ZOSMA_134G00160 [Zostera marina]|uniref:Lariat debranching enzyme C-terminal domain-containing protein n=1 Tax=Zostera marina TaxID=29655 RepID=A0A0K9Q133_ZOSMR|nr:hypothetical protein ZOSMA_134G00160 [Zostera marina]